MVYNADLNAGFIDSLFYLNSYYGITQDPITNDFIIIMKYYKYDLKHYIAENFYIIDWNKKLKILKSIISGLEHIHEQEIIHRDFHSGNILYENEYDIVISDLGISKSSTESIDNDKIYGIISYVAPEIFQGQKYTTSSDIYSFGMIMWELMTGRMPFWDQNNDLGLIIKICKDFRPPIIKNIPEGYAELMKKCWDPDSNKRPTAFVIIENLTDIMRAEEENLTEIIKSPNIGPIVTNNSNKSRPLSKMIDHIRSSRSQSIFISPPHMSLGNDLLYNDLFLTIL